MRNALYLMDPKNWDVLYGPEQRHAIAGMVDIGEECFDRETLFADPRNLSHIEVVMGGWGMPVLDERFMTRLPALKAIFYAGGAVGRIATDLIWQRNIAFSNANAPNGVPVAEFTASMIHLCLKHAFQFAAATRASRKFMRDHHPPGAYRSTVGLLSLGAIGAMVARKLQHTDVRVIAYDPFVAPDAAAALGVTLASLEAVFAESDVVSCHVPWLPETENLLRGKHFASMKPGASFVNTARGAIVNEPEMVDVLQARPDLFAVLDVTWPEPPMAESKLFDLPNVLLTPHIAGSLGDECRRMGQAMADELGRWLRGEALQNAVTRQYARGLP